MLFTDIFLQLRIKPLLSPRSLPGLQLWLDAGNGPDDPVDGQPVTTWADRSGNANDFTQATAAAKPTFKVNIVNGRPVVRFDGTDDVLAATALSPKHLFVVCDGVGGLNSRPDIFYGSGLSTTQYIGSDNDGAGNVNAGLTLGTDPSTVFAIHEAHYTSPTVTLRSSLTASTQTLTSNTSDSRALLLANLGRSVEQATPNYAEFFTGDIAEVVAYSRVLSIAERARVRKYLSLKYAISLA